MTPQGLSSVKQAILEQLRQQVVPELERLVGELPDELLDFGQAENRLRVGMLDLGRRLLGLWTQCADRVAKRPCCPRCGVPMRNKGLVPAEIASTLGSVTYRRPRWRCDGPDGCGRECYPHDRTLRFGTERGTHGVSWALARVLSRMAADIASFEGARDCLEEDYRVHLAKETVRRIAEEAGSDVLGQEDRIRAAVMERTQPLPEPSSDVPPAARTPDTAYVFADGTMVHAEGDWHEVRVLTTATETADGRLLVRRSVARFVPPEDVAWQLTMLARSAGYHNARQKVFLADGAAWLWKLQEEYFGGATAILDWYHLAEKVHMAANGLFGEATTEAKSWAESIKDELWEGRVDAALEEVRAQELRARAPTRREAIHALRTYLENQRGHVDYPRYRAMGLSIGSGQVEAQCKSLVGARCKQAGMRDWTYAGAEAVLRLRAARHDKTFDAIWEQRLRVAA
jgi:hypothetical protein